MAWAFATLSVQDVPLWASISSSAMRSMSDFGTQSLANTAWAGATLKVCDAPLLDALASSALPRIRQFSVQELSNTSWAIATRGVRHHGPLIAAISSSSIAKMSEFPPQALTNTAWAYAPFDVRDMPLLSAISAQSIRRSTDFNTQELANTAWAFALLGVRDAPLMEALAAASLRKIPQFELRGLANTAWAGATLAFKDRPLLAAIAAASMPKMASLGGGAAVDRPDVSVLALAYSLAHLDALDAPTLDALRAALARLAAARERALGAASRGGPCRDAQAAATAARDATAPGVLREAGGLCVLFKPPGWTVSVGTDEDGGEAVGAPARRRKVPERAMQDWIAGELGEGCHIVHDGGASCGLLHRLDKQTSGALVWARDYSSYYTARLQFARRHVRKEYVCLCVGSTSPRPRFLEEPLQEWGDDRQVAECTVCSPWGRPALSEIRSVGHLTSPDGLGASLVQVRIHTGRRHQIRAHLTGEGHPLLGDSAYAGPCPPWVARMFLHALRLRLASPEGLLSVEVPLPEDLRTALGLLAAADGPARVGAGWLLAAWAR